MPKESTLPKIQPLEDRVVVQPEEAERVTPGGLYIPDNAQEKPQRGTVIAVGPGRYEAGTLVPPALAPGDTVIYSKYGTTEVTVDDVTYLILGSRDLLAVLG